MVDFLFGWIPLPDTCEPALTSARMITSPTLSPLDCQLQLPNRRKILAIYALTLLMYTLASRDPDPNSRGGSELPNPKSEILR